MGLIRSLRQRSTTARRLKRALYQLLLANRRMRFPTFGDDVHAELVGEQDYFRYATLSLALRQVLSAPIPGALAEVGVYRGHTSRIIHSVAPERTLYLFDTFEGFPGHQLEGWQKGDARFRDTDAEAVRRYVGASDRVVIRKGYVPDTLAGHEDERFAFVLLDLDLYEPTRQCLDFFYPRLNTGGYLFVHDYNNPESNWACKRAFDDFMRDRPEQIVEIGDIWGSALVRKARS